MEITVDKDSETPLYIQIRDSINLFIEKGQLQPGDKLPPVTTLAKEIGVTHATVRRALEDLKNQGHTECHVGRGTFICTPAEKNHKNESQNTFTRQENEPIITGAAQKLRNSMSKALHDIMALADRPNIIKLTAGVPDHSLLPANLLDHFSSTVENGLYEVLDTSDPLGDLTLRREIATRISNDSITVSPDNVLITNGSIQACSLLAQSILGSNKPVLFETPCYTGMANSFSAMGQWVTAIPRDHQGPDPEMLEKYKTTPPALLYLCPYAHNPMGTDLTEERAELITTWAKETQCFVIADEIFKDLGYSDTPVPSIICKLGLKQTVVISSLSKTISPGLRLGWIVASESRISQLSKLKRVMDYATPPYMQHVGTQILTSGLYEEHTRKVTEIYKSRMDYLIKLLQQNMNSLVTWTVPDGGFSILLSLPNGYSSISLFLSAIAKGVAFLPGPLFDLDQRFVNSFRLSCAHADHQELKEGVELLSDAVNEILEAPRDHLGLNGLGNFQ